MSASATMAMELFNGLTWSLSYNGTTTSTVVAAAASINNLADNAFTVDGYYREESIGEGGFGYLIEKGAGWVVFNYVGSIRAIVGCATTNAIAECTFAPDGKWHHWGFTFDDAGDRKIYLYKDHVLVATSSAGVGAVSSDTTDDVIIGNNAATSRTFDGAIGWVRLSDTVRDLASESYARYNPPAIDGNTVLQINMTEGTGTAVADSSGNANNGTITDGEWESENIWTTLTDDVLYPVRVSYGILGNDALDRVAQTGEMTFSLNNSEYNNSGIGSIGYYSPGHPNCMPGFATGGTVRLSFQYSTTAGTELLRNTGFETAGTGGADTFDVWAEGHGAGTIIDETSLVHSGGHACKMTRGGYDTTSVYQYRLVTPGAEYVYSLWNAGDGGTLSGRYAIYSDPGFAAIVPFTETGQTAGSYARTMGTFTVPDGVNAIRFYLRPPNGSALTSYFDDIALTFTESTQTKFYGRIPPDGIQVTTGTKGTRRTNVTVRDWMEQAATQEISVISYENDQKISAVVGSIVEGMPVQPGTVSYEDGISVFPASFDTSGGKTKVMTEMQKVAVSELGYIYITHDSASDEILKVEDRQTRNEIVYTDSQIDGAFKIVDVNNTMLAGEATTKKNYNRITAKVYPRTYDDSYVTLYSLQSPVSVPADTTLIIDGLYRDPDNNAYSVSGKEMQTPVINTDYTFNTADDDSGADISDKLTVTPEYGVSKVRYTLVNTSSTKNGYVTKLNARGKGIYLYEPIYYSTETDGAAAIGSYELTLDLKYHDDLNEAISFADSFKSLSENADAISLDKVTSIANSSIQQMAAFMNRDVGSLVNISEGVTGYTLKGHFIQGVQFTVQQGGIIRYTWYLKPSAKSQVYWRLDTVYRSELDLYTILAI